MSDYLSDLFAKIEKYVSNQAETYIGLPSEVLSPISDVENRLIAKRLQNLQNEQDVDFSIDEILPIIAQIEVSENEEHIEENEPPLLEELIIKDEVNSISENEVSSELSDLPIYEIETEAIEETSELEEEIDSENEVSSELSDLPSDEIEPEVIEETSELELDTDSEFEDKIIAETEELVLTDKSVEFSESEISIDETEEEFLTIADSDNSIEEISDKSSEVSVLDSPIEDESYIDSENEEIDLSSNKSEFSLEDNSDSSQENEEVSESNDSEIVSEEVKEEPEEETLQFDLFGPIPSKPSTKASYPTSEALRTPSLFDIKPSQKEPNSEINSIESSKTEVEIEPETNNDLVGNTVLENKTSLEIESESKIELENSTEKPIQGNANFHESDSESNKSVEEIAESTQIEDSHKTELLANSPKSSEGIYSESIESNSIPDLLSEPPLQTSFKETSSLIATYIPISMTDPIQLQKELNECVTLEDLRLLCEKHKDLLRTDLEDTNLVFGVGNPNAKLVIVGEAPGENEDKQGEPFVGKAGQLLDKILEAIEFSRKDIYIANILKHRPPKNRDPLPEERERSLPFLLRQIEIIQPKLVLCLGRISARTLLGLPDSVSLAQIRGKFHPFLNNTIELTATYHPASLLRNPNWKKPTWEDVQMIRKRYDELS